MYYSEQLQSPISEANCRSIFGINPATPEAQKLGFYPLIEAPSGYTPTGYVKQGNTYKATYLSIPDAIVNFIVSDPTFVKPYAVVGDYSEEPNSGPKNGFRPCNFFNLDSAFNPVVDVTVKGDITLPTPGTFIYTATGVDPTQPLADFLAAVVVGLGTQTDVYFGVERNGTCLGIVGQLTYEIDNVQVKIV
jgi:hypothetical protein